MALTNPAYNALPQLTNIQGFWRMEEESGTRADLSDNANTLADNNTVLYAAGKIGNAGDFELSQSEYLSIADGSQTGLDITGEITICAWIKPETTGTVEKAIVCKYEATENAYRLKIYNAAVEFMLASGASGTNQTECDSAATVVSAGTWAHVACTLNQTTDLMQVYINGVASGSAVAYTHDIYNCSAAFCIGGQSTPSLYFDGLIDEVIIWNTCLTAAEVLQVKNITTVEDYKKVVAGGFSGFSPWIF